MPPGDMGPEPSLTSVGFPLSTPQPAAVSELNG